MRTLLAVLSRPDNIPIAVMVPLFTVILVWWWRQARRNDRLVREGGEEAVKRVMDGPPLAAGESLPGGKVTTWPHLLKIELVGALALLLLLVVWSILVDAPLEQLADPNRTPNPSKAPWYFLGLQEMLVYFDPWIAGVALPCLIIGGLCAIPYLDLSTQGSGFMSWRGRRFALSIFLLGLYGLWLPLILIGTFFRGPGWSWIWPWQSFADVHEVPHATRNLGAVLGLSGDGAAAVFGAALLVAYFGGGFLVAFRARGGILVRRLGRWRTGILAFLALAMLGLPIKVALRLLLSVKYVFASSWFNV